MPSALLVRGRFHGAGRPCSDDRQVGDKHEDLTEGSTCATALAVEAMPIAVTLEPHFSDALGFASGGPLQESTRLNVRASVASLNRGTQFDARLWTALVEAAGRRASGGRRIVCFAGHHAGGHGPGAQRHGGEPGPAEHVELEYATAAARVVQAAPEALV